MLTALPEEVEGAVAEGAELLTLQALSVALQVEQDWDPVKYVRCHPGGKLGQLREGEVK